MRSAIAHGDQHLKDRASGGRVQGGAARIRFPAGTLEDHLVGVARGPCALLRRAHGPGQAAAGRRCCGRSRARPPAAHPPNRRRSAAGCGRRGGAASCPGAARAEASGHSSSVYSRSATMPRARPGISSRSASTWSGSKRHADRRAGIGGEHLRHPFHQPAVAVRNDS